MAMSPWPRQFMHDFWDTDFGRPFSRSPVLFDQKFGIGVKDEELMPPTLYHNYYLRPRRQLSRDVSGSSEVKDEASEFKVMLDINQFSPEEIQVKTVDNFIVIEAKHEEKMDDHGFVSRQFTRKYVLPEGVKPEVVRSNLSRDGILTITAPKAAIEAEKSNERVVPISLSGSGIVPTPVSAPKSPEPMQTAKPQVSPAQK